MICQGLFIDVDGQVCGVDILCKNLSVLGTDFLCTKEDHVIAHSLIVCLGKETILLSQQSHVAFIVNLCNDNDTGLSFKVLDFRSEYDRRNAAVDRAIVVCAPKVFRQRVPQVSCRLNDSGSILLIELYNVPRTRQRPQYSECQKKTPKPWVFAERDDGIIPSSL